MDSIEPSTIVLGLQISSWKGKLSLLQSLASQIKNKEAEICSS
jgi:hypothetical protein